VAEPPIRLQPPRNVVGVTRHQASKNKARGPKRHEKTSHEHGNGLKGNGKKTVVHALGPELGGV